MNRTETRVKISTSASNFHKSLRENTSKFGESKVNAKALMMIISVIITDMGSCFICTQTCAWRMVVIGINFFIQAKKWNLIIQEHHHWSPFEINYRALIAMRETGKGFTGLSNFCGFNFMNSPPPMLNVKAFNDMQEKIVSTYTYILCCWWLHEKCCKWTNLFLHKGKVMKIFILKTILLVGIYCTVLNDVDGSWQKCGYSSLNENGVVTVVGSW